MKNLKERVYEALKNSKSLESDLDNMEANIQDPSTNATNTRRLNISVIVSPGSERDTGDVRIETRSTLARRTVLEDTVTFGGHRALPMGETK